MLFIIVITSIFTEWIITKTQKTKQWELVECFKCYFMFRFVYLFSSSTHYLSYGITQFAIQWNSFRNTIISLAKHAAILFWLRIHYYNRVRTITAKNNWFMSLTLDGPHPLMAIPKRISKWIDFGCEIFYRKDTMVWNCN